MPIDLYTVKVFVQQNIGVVHTIKDVAEKLQVSSETLKKDFLRKEGLGLSDFIKRARIEKMKDLLGNSGEKSFSICLAVGLREDTGATFFKKRMGITMGEFRRRQKKDENEVIEGSQPASTRFPP